MTPEDKALARRAIEEKKLTIEQVQEIRAEVDRTGRSFQDVAAARGLLAVRVSAPLAPGAVPDRARAPVAASSQLWTIRHPRVSHV